jgi:hypothetical protein
MLYKIVRIKPSFVTWEGRAVISVVVLQNQMDLLRGELGSCSETYDITEVDERERMTVPVMKTEPKVSCVCREFMHISYRLYPEFSAPLSVYTWETKIWLSRMDFEQFLRKETFILCHTASEVPLEI